MHGERTAFEFRKGKLSTITEYPNKTMVSNSSELRAENTRYGKAVEAAIREIVGRRKIIELSTGGKQQIVCIPVLKPAEGFVFIFPKEFARPEIGGRVVDGMMFSPVVTEPTLLGAIGWMNGKMLQGETEYQIQVPDRDGGSYTSNHQTSPAERQDSSEARTELKEAEILAAEIEEALKYLREQGQQEELYMDEVKEQARGLAKQIRLGGDDGRARALDELRDIHADATSEARLAAAEAEVAPLAKPKKRADGSSVEVREVLKGLANLEERMGGAPESAPSAELPPLEKLPDSEGSRNVKNALRKLQRFPDNDKRPSVEVAPQGGMAETTIKVPELKIATPDGIIREINMFLELLHKEQAFSDARVDEIRTRVEELQEIWRKSAGTKQAAKEEREVVRELRAERDLLLETYKQLPNRVKRRVERVAAQAARPSRLRKPALERPPFVTTGEMLESIWN